MPEAALRPSPPDCGYDRDLYLWTQAQAALLRARRFADLDLANLIEEIESVGGSQKTEIRSRLVVLLLHLLKWEHQPGRRKYGWRATIIEQRVQIDGLIEVSPSLRSWPDAILQKAYRLAVTKAADETNLPVDACPERCPYALAQVLDFAFYPGPPEADVV